MDLLAPLFASFIFAFLCSKNHNRFHHFSILSNCSSLPSLTLVYLHGCEPNCGNVDYFWILVNNENGSKSLDTYLKHSYAPMVLMLHRLHMTMASVLLLLHLHLHLYLFRKYFFSSLHPY